jgi:aminoglycoside phosphotransferase (APT) family kinase protein
MTVPAPVDRVLGSGAAALLDGDGVAARLAATAGQDVTCTPKYARWKPETSLLVQYDATVEGRRALLHAWLFADGRADRTWSSPPFARLRERAARRHPELQFTAAFLRDSGVLVEASPLDSRLPALVRAASAKKLARLLGDRGLRDARPETLRHKPGRKAVLRAGRLYVKVHARGAPAARAELASAVAQAGIPTAPPRAVLSDLGAVVYAEAPGVRLADFRDTPEHAGWFEPAAEALVAFHRRAPIDRAGVSEDARLLSAGRAVDALAPQLRGVGGRLAAAVAKRLRTTSAVVLAHGDFYDDQLLVGGEHVVILDLDEARPGHPLLDVGNFLAHLSAASRESLRHGFLDACERAGFDLDGVLVFEAAALLALAVGPFRRLEPDWPDRVERIVELAAERLGEDPRPADRGLPQIRSLVDAAPAGAVLGRALGRRVRVSSVEVVRRKEGRRCTLRYRLEGGETVYAKTYAGPRAARVHESLRLIAAGTKLRTPHPLGWDREANLVVTGCVRGQPVRERVLRGDRALGVEIADGLLSLHCARIELAQRHSLADEVEPLGASAERLAAQASALTPVALRCAALAAAGRCLDWDWRWRPVHRDFYEDQLLDGAGGLGILDFDDAAMSEPAVDVANLVAHLELLGVRTGRSGPVEVSDAFVNHYRARDPALDEQLVTFLRGTTLLRLAGIHVDRAGTEVTGRLLGRSETALRRVLR